MPEQVRAVLDSRPADRLDLLLHAPKPMRLVRSLPDSELYLTVREIGPADSLALLTLASSDQIHHVMDLESWRDDRFDPERAGAWTAVLIEAGEPTLRRYVRTADDDTLVLLLRHWARVSQVEFDDQIPIHGAGESEAGDERGFVSPDGFHRFSPKLQEHAPAIRKFAQLLFTEEPERYQRVVWEAISGPPAESEESAMRWRTSRLEEHGYPPYDEALTIYAPPSGSPATSPVVQDPDAPIAPRTALTDLGRDALLAEALRDTAQPVRESFLGQLVAVANRVMVADHLDPGDVRSHRAAMRVVTGFVEIALEARRDTPGNEPGQTVTTVPAIELFREGHAPVAALSVRARTLVDRGWPRGERGHLELLDPPLLPRLEGVLLDRPRYLDLEAPDEARPYREFRSRAEVDETRRAIELTEVLGTVFLERLGLDVGALRRASDHSGRELPRFSALFLTLTAWHATRDDWRLEPLPAEVVADFLRDVASRRTASPGAAERATRAAARMLAERSGLDARQAGALEAFGVACAAELDAECGRLDPGTPVDPRHVHCLIVGQPSTSEGPDG